MVWFCPTFERPKRLQELAEAWEKTAQGEPLFVRVWNQDKFKKEYFSMDWPRTWTLYESPAQWCGEALQEFFRLHPDEQQYGFIGDDVIPCTDNWPEILSVAAGDWYLAYPNDTIQRHGLATHFLLGGELLRTLGWWVPEGFKHHYLDQVLQNIAVNAGLARFCPEVTFYHKHQLKGRAENDHVYRKADVIFNEGMERWDEYVENELKQDVMKVRHRIMTEFEIPHLEWMRNGFIHC